MSEGTATVCTFKLAKLLLPPTMSLGLVMTLLIRGALEREGTILELLVKLFALIVYAMIDDNRRDETEASIGRINAHDVEPIEEKLELLAQSARLLFVPLDFDCLEPEALGPGPGASHLDLVYL